MATNDGGRGWIGVDLDGTLAVYDKWRGERHVGEPIERMVQRVKRWLAAGVEVRIFTARVCGLNSSNSYRRLKATQAREVIRAWCFKVFDETLPVTNEKDYGMLQLWDDRCVHVEMNTGRVLG